MEKRAVYIITNKKNNKSYIGQTKHPQQRFKEHSRVCKNYTSLISQAIQKHGKDNFEFKILGWYEDYLKKEREMIALYKTLIPNGYNIQEGGENPPLWKGEAHPLAKLSQKEVDAIQLDMMYNWDMRFKDFQKKYSLTKNQFRHIKEGNSWKKEDLIYPLRPNEKEINILRANQVIYLLKTTNLTQKEIGRIVGWGRSAVTMINIGKNHFRKEETYPIRK